MRAGTFLLLALLALAGCQHLEAAGSPPPAPAPDVSGWRLSSGKIPTKAEYTALTATCQSKGGALAPCLTELGLKKAP